MCATCHVYVDESWIASPAGDGDDEDALLDGAAAERLREQPAVLPDQDRAGELDGLVLRLPEPKNLRGRS